MRYALPVDKLVNQLTPHFWGGRKNILFLQSLVFPLKSLNEKFMIFANEKSIEAKMTSQVMYFEWYLNYKFSKYFTNKGDKISIIDSSDVGVSIYHENAETGVPFTVWYDNEVFPVLTNPEEHPKELYLTTENKAINKASFMISVPSIAINQKEFVYMLSFVTNTYKLAGKTYLIKINGVDIDPNVTL